MAKAPVLTPQADDFPRWYQDVLAKAELAQVLAEPLTGNGSDNTEAVAIQLGLTVEPGDQRVPGGVSIGRTQVLNPH
mgnify:CR=1 FL=1